MSKWETLSNVLDVQNTTVFLVWCVWTCASAVACHSLQDMPFPSRPGAMA